MHPERNWITPSISVVWAPYCLCYTQKNVFTRLQSFIVVVYRKMFFGHLCVHMSCMETIQHSVPNLYVVGWSKEMVVGQVAAEHVL